MPTRQWRPILVLALLLSVLLFVPAAAQQPLSPPTHLLKLAHSHSIVAWDSATGDLGSGRYGEHGIDRLALDDILNKRKAGAK